MRWLDSITDAMNMNLGKLLGDGEEQGEDCMLQSMGSQRVGHGWEMTEKQHIFKYAAVFIYTYIDSFNPYSNPKKRHFDCSYFTDKETKAQRREVTCPSCKADMGSGTLN